MPSPPAVPALKITGFPIGVPPKKKLTVPVGAFPKLLVEIVAESVTLAPTFTLLELEATMIVVGAFVIVTEPVAEVLALKLASPL